MKYTIVGILVTLSVVYTAAAVPTVSYAESVNCMCVAYLSQVLGIDIHGNADTILPNIPSDYVEVGDVILFSYPKVDHVALVTSITSKDGMTGFIISESNYHRCKPDTRFVPFNDPAIRGIYRPSFSTSL